MKNSIIALLLFCSFTLHAQIGTNELITAGIELHEAGKYDEAIEKYKEALKIDKKSNVANYEIGYALFAKKEYEEAITYLNKVLKSKDKNSKKESYILKGSALDVLGKPEEAIKCYNKGIKNFPEEFLLYFNLGITQYNSGDIAGAEESIINALTHNPVHTTSNNILGLIKSQQGRKVESVLAYHFFLTLEPTSQRSESALKTLKQLMAYGVTKKSDTEIEVSLNFSGVDDPFSMPNLMLSLMAATNLSEENEDKTDQELFIENTESLFTSLKEQRKKNKGLWWDLYVDFYSELLDKGHIEAYCYYITQLDKTTHEQWFEENDGKMEKFYTWLENVSL